MFVKGVSAGPNHSGESALQIVGFVWRPSIGTAVGKHCNTRKVELEEPGGGVLGCQDPQTKVP